MLFNWRSSNWRQWSCCDSCYQLRDAMKTALNPYTVIYTTVVVASLYISTHLIPTHVDTVLVIVPPRFNHHSLHYSCCFNSLDSAFLVHTVVRLKMSRFIELVRLPTFNISHRQVSSTNELFSLEIRLTILWEQKSSTASTDRLQLLYMTRDLLWTTRLRTDLNETMKKLSRRIFFLSEMF